MSNLEAMLRNWKTTIIGLVPMILGLLVAFGIIDLNPEEATETISSTLEVIIIAVLEVVGFIGLFSRDADKSSEDTGLKHVGNRPNDRG